MFVSKCYKRKHLGKDSLFHKKPKFGRQNHYFCSVKMGGKGEITMKTRIWATAIENVARKAEIKPILGPKCARFLSENANLTNGTHFTHILPPHQTEHTKWGTNRGGVNLDSGNSALEIGF